MSLKHTWTTAIKNDSATTVVNDPEIITGNDEQNFNDSAAGGTTKHISVGSIVKANIQSFYIVSDKAVTLKVNSSSTPEQTVSLTANRAYAWNNLMPITNPLTSTTITDLYFVNAGASPANDAVVKGGFLLNQ